MAFVENLTDFVNPNTPGYLEAQYLGDTVGILFDNGYDEQFNTAGTNPFATVIASELAGVAVGSELTINSVDYNVTNIRPDGFGILVLDLEVSS